MGLNKSKGNMYPWITHTWNTIKGHCYHDCSYCYMKRFGDLNPVRFDKKELKTDLGHGNYIFVGSSCDMWTDEIPGEWIYSTIEHCTMFDNNYFFQTKNPNAFGGYGAMITQLNKFSLCITVETNRMYEDIMRNAPDPYIRIDDFMKIPHNEKYITIEPVMDFDLDVFLTLLIDSKVKQINIGADSGKNNLPEPSKSKILELISELEKFTVVKQKKNLKRLL